MTPTKRILGIMIQKQDIVFLSFWSVLLFSLYWPALGWDLFWDDSKFIFENPAILGNNPFLFWLRGQSQTKAWPLAYTFLWLLHKLFGDQYFQYRFLSLLFHFFNGVLAWKISSAMGSKMGKFSALIVWLHPLNVETVSWIIQITKILSGTFLLIWFLHAQKKDSPSVRGLSLLASMLCQGYSYFLCFLEVSLWKEKMGLIRAFLLSIPFIALFAYGAFLVAAGTFLPMGEKTMGQRYLKPSTNIVSSQTKEQIQKEETFFSTSNAEIWNQSTKSAYIYFLSFFKNQSPDEELNTKDFWVKKISLVGNTSFFYTFSFFIPFFNRSMYPKNFFTFIPEQIYFYFGLIFLIALIIILVRGDILRRTLLLCFLPISGLFYVPYMKITWVADRFLYVCILFASILVVTALKEKSNTKRIFLWAWIIGMTYRTYTYLPYMLELPFPANPF